MADIEKQIEEMAKTYCHQPWSCSKCTHTNCTCKNVCKDLVNEGYGNVRQALTEFAKRLTEDVFPLAPNYLMAHGIDHRRYSCKEINRAVYKTLKEFLGE